MEKNMRAKTALVSGLLSMLCAIPAFAAHTTPAGHYVQHAAAAGVICGDPTYDYDVTTTWTSQNLHYKFNVNIPANSEADAGLRLDCPSNQQANYFQMDVNTYNANDPYFFVYANVPGYGPEYWTYAHLFQIPEYGFTAVNLRNGYTRYTYTAANDSLGKGASFNSIYFWDSSSTVDISDTVTNISVNGLAVLPILQPIPYADCNGSGL